MSKAIRTYKGLLRAINVAFGDDLTAKAAAMDRVRSEYRSAADAHGPELSQKLQIARDAAAILRTHVVQGERDSDEGAFKLKIHKETELGDNDSRYETAMAGSGGSDASGCCGGSGKP